MNNTSLSAIGVAILLLFGGIAGFAVEQGVAGIFLTIGGAVALSVAAYARLVTGSGEKE